MPKIGLKFGKNTQISKMLNSTDNSLYSLPKKYAAYEKVRDRMEKRSNNFW